MSRRATLLALVATVTLSACGGATTPTTPSGGSDTQTITGSVGAYGTASHSVQAARAGSLTVTLSWSGNADLDLYLTPIDCTGYPPDACDILVRSTASSGNQEIVEWPAVANQQFKVWIDNFSPTTSTSYTVVATLK